MAKDYAKKTKPTQSASRGVGKKKNSTSNGMPPALWMIGGVLLGLFAAGLIFIKLHHVQRIQRSMQQALQIKTVPNQENTQEKLQENSGTHKHPEFDFYTILPKETVWQPNPEVQPTKKKIAPPFPTTYILQVAAFKQYQDADKMKAKLLLEGYAANTKSDKDWNRVWLGPFKTLQQAQEAQLKIAKSDNMKGLITTVP